MRRLAGIVLLAAALAGCGNSRARPADVEHPDAPEGVRTVAFDGGVVFDGPANWLSFPAAPPLLGGIRSKSATVAVWLYPRTEPLPKGEAALELARTRLIERVKLRNPSFAVRSSRVRGRGGAKGIELVGTQTLGGRAFETRSSHLFKGGAEIVVDAYAPAGDFERVDPTVFQPLLRSLKVGRR